MIKSLFTPKPAIYCRDFPYLFLDFWCFILWLKSSKTAKRLRNKLVLPQKKQKFWQLFNIFKSWQNKQFTFCKLLCFFSMISFVTFPVKEATFFCCIKVLNKEKSRFKQMNRDFWLFDKNKSRLVHNWFLQFDHFRYLHIITSNKWFLCGVLGNYPKFIDA